MVIACFDDWACIDDDWACADCDLACIDGDDSICDIDGLDGLTPEEITAYNAEERARDQAYQELIRLTTPSEYERYIKPFKYQY